MVMCLQEWGAHKTQKKIRGSPKYIPQPSLGTDDLRNKGNL